MLKLLENLPDLRSWTSCLALTRGNGTAACRQLKNATINSCILLLSVHFYATSSDVLAFLIIFWPLKNIEQTKKYRVTFMSHITPVKFLAFPQTFWLKNEIYIETFQLLFRKIFTGWKK